MSEYLAEASVLIRPNTAGFAAILRAELKAIAAANPVVIPVIAAGSGQVTAGIAAANKAVAASSTVASTALGKQTVQTAAMGAATTKAQIITGNFAKAQDLGAAATARLAGAAKAAALTTSELAAARAVLRETTAATALADRAVGAALVAGNIALIDAAANTAALARARQLEATTAVEAAIAERGLAAAQAQVASQQAFVKRGALATALSLFGVRGATLAANSAFLVGAAAAVTFAKSVSLAAGFEQQLNVFRVTAEATADQMKEVSEAATALGRDVSLPSVSAGDAAETMTELAKAGLDVQDSIAGARGVLQLSAAAQISNAEATEIAASALNAFGLEGDQAVRVADLLANAANNAQGSIADMGLSLRQAAAVARQVGFSVEDTTALLTLLAKNGIQGSDAGTALRTSLIRLINPSKEAAEAIGKLGLRIRDAQGNLRPEVFAEFAEATADLTRKEADATAALVFGQDAIRAQAILGREGAVGLNEMREALDRQGAAAELAGARAQGFSGKLSALGSNLETLGTKMGGFTLGPLGLFIDGINTLVNDLLTVPDVLARIEKGLDSLIPDLVSFSSLDPFAFTRGGGPDKAFSDGAQGLVDSLGIAAFQLRNVQKELATATNRTEILARALDQEFTARGINEDTAAVQELIEQLEGGGVEAQALAKELEVVVRAMAALGREPTIIELQMLLDQGSLQREVKIAKQTILEGFYPIKGAMRDVGGEIMESLGEGIKQGAAELKNPFAGLPTGETTQQFQSGQSALEAAVLDAQIADDRKGELVAQRKKEQQIRSRMAQVKGDKKATDKLRSDLAAVTSAIRSIEDAIAADAESAANKRESDARKAADDIEKAIREADDALLDSLDVGQTKARNAALIAASTDTLTDDIRAQVTLRGIITKQIEAARNKIKDRKTLAEFLRAQNAELLRINLAIDDLREREVLERVNKRVGAGEDKVADAALTASLNDDIRAQINLRKIVTQAIAKLQDEGGQAIAAIQAFIDQRKSIKQRIAQLRRDQAQERLEGIQLNIEFAQITENRSAEVRGREAEIRAIQDQIAHEKKGTNEYRRLRNELAAKRKELAELKKEKDKTNAFAAETFKFLQTQQGFAANLLGNLLDPGATAGILEGTASPTGSGPPIPALNLTSGIDPKTGRPFRESGGPADGLARQAAEKSVAPGGPTKGGQATEIDILRQLLRVLEDIRRGTGHPEAQYNKTTTKAALEYQGGV